MLYQREGERKPAVAECAVVRSLLRVMSAVVFSEVHCLAEVLPALGALEGLLSGVDAQMDPKLRLLMKSLSAVTALMRLVLLLKRIQCFNAWEEKMTQCVTWSSEKWSPGKVFVII